MVAKVTVSAVKVLLFADSLANFPFVSIWKEIRDELKKKKKQGELVLLEQGGSRPPPPPLPTSLLLMKLKRSSSRCLVIHLRAVVRGNQAHQNLQRLMKVTQNGF